MRHRRGREKDGISHRRKGEGPNHEGPLAVGQGQSLEPSSAPTRRSKRKPSSSSIPRIASTCSIQDPNSTVAIDVKSSDSDNADRRCGVFQCIKYRAVMEAMGIRSGPRVIVILITQRRLPGELKDFLRHHRTRHFRIPAHFGSASPPEALSVQSTASMVSRLRLDLTVRTECWITLVPRVESGSLPAMTSSFPVHHRTLREVWLRRGTAPNSHAPGKLHPISLSELGNAAARETFATATLPFAAAWTDLFESMTAVKHALRWRENGPGLGRDARIAYSSLLRALHGASVLDRE